MQNNDDLNDETERIPGEEEKEEQLGTFYQKTAKETYINAKVS